ncbi:CBS domain-containing protein [Bacillus sp. FJAT-47783]|uniref:CBS domain-containing protein n=1 Tax=Bacillus sp. FJAT-47783 TaxID=2922712 RepID=UPI001FABC23A|nr:CBS domain-containing protein [Bacillus sp. FJAT-47783]
MKTVRDVMTTHVDCCTTLDNVYEAALKMKELNVGAIPIIENDQLVGMVTDRDLVVRGIAEKHPGSSKITDIMTKDITTVSPSDSVEKALQVMSEQQIRRLPVLESGKLVGIVSLGDFSIEEQSDELAGEALSDISEHDNHH